MDARSVPRFLASVWLGKVTPLAALRALRLAARLVQSAASPMAVLVPSLLPALAAPAREVREAALEVTHTRSLLFFSFMPLLSNAGLMPGHRESNRLYWLRKMNELSPNMVMTSIKYNQIRIYSQNRTYRFECLHSRRVVFGHDSQL